MACFDIGHDLKFKARPSMQEEYMPSTSNLVYHFVTKTKYRHLAIADIVDECLRQVCAGIEEFYDWIRFLEIGCDQDHVHYMIQSTPGHSPAEIIRVVKSITERRIYAAHPEAREMLWGANLWSEGYSVVTVDKHGIENSLKDYVESHGQEYRLLYSR